MSSPIEWRRPPTARTPSITSEGPPLPSYRVKGARSGAVTEFLLIVRDSLCVPAAINNTMNFG